MNNKEFHKFHTQLNAKERHLVISKGDEYAPNNDRFENFKNGCKLQVPGDTPEGCAWNYMSKHLESIMSGLRDLSVGKERSMEFWHEKLGDVRIYSSLILAMLEERAQISEKLHKEKLASERKPINKPIDLPELID